MKKNKYLIFTIVVLVGLLGIAISLSITNQGNNTIAEGAENYAFSIEDTASITKIIISDKVPSRVELIKENGTWLVNGKYPLRKESLDLLLETFYRMKLRNFPPQTAIPNIIKRMAVHGKEVTIYAGEKEIKHFYVGTETSDLLGTYMMIHGADQPYAVYIPGFNGYLSSRFFTDEAMWRDRTIFGYDNTELKQIEVFYPDSLKASFKMNINSLEDIELYRWDGTRINQFNLKAAQVYLASFRNTNYEGAIIPSDAIWAKKDSVLASAPIFTITARTANDEKTLKAYHIKAPADVVDTYGMPMAWDPDRFYASISDGRFVLAQYYGTSTLVIGLHHLGVRQ